MQPRLALFALISLIFSLAGCGGGGGPAMSSGSLTYTTDWSLRNSGRGVTGQSQHIMILNSAGTITDSRVANQDTNGSVTYHLSGTPAGEYLLKVELFSGRDNTGVKTGELDVQVTDANATVDTMVGEDLSAVKVSPTPTTMSVDSSKQFYGAGVFNGTYVFTKQSDFTWSQTGDFSTITNSGVATGTAAGTGSVRALHVPSGILGSARITVNVFTATQGKWTVMIFLNSANNLIPDAFLNMNQMEHLGQGSNVRFVVQWKQIRQVGVNESPTFEGTRRYLVTHDSSNENDFSGVVRSQLVQDMGDGVDMGNASTLSDFINYSKSHYPADHYALVIWNHGNGWQRGTKPPAYRGISYDDEFNSGIQTWQLSQALGSTHLDILSYDACLMQMIEVAAEVRDHCDFIACSEENTPAAGYPYNLTFANFFSNPTDTPKNLSKGFVDGSLAYYASPHPSEAITQSVIDTTKIASLETAVDALGAALKNNKVALTSLVQQIRANAHNFGDDAFHTRFYYDLYDVATRLKAGTNIAEVTDAATAVQTAVTNAVVWEGHNTLSSNSKGIAIDFSAADNWPQIDYAQLRFAHETRWDDWLSVAP